MPDEKDSQILQARADLDKFREKHWQYFHGFGPRVSPDGLITYQDRQPALDREANRLFEICTRLNRG